MAAQWSPKDPGDTADYWFDWDAFLPPGEDITASTVTVTDAELDIVITDETARNVRVRFSGGTLGANHDSFCEITTDAGQVFKAKKVLPVRERIIQ